METRFYLGRIVERTGSVSQSWWTNHQDVGLRVAALLMSTAALVWLLYEFWRLVWGSDPFWPSSPVGAVDLKLRHDEIYRWFRQMPVYSELPDAILPPATYMLLWPLLGWLPLTPARWLWAATTLGALVWLSYLVVRESQAATPRERAVAALMPFSMYATGATIGNGQVIVHIMPILITGMLLLRQERGWRADALAAVLLLITLIKPSISIPFFWIALFVAHSLRPAILVVLAYCTLTVFAASFQQGHLISLLGEWLARASDAAVKQGQGNVANLHVWLGNIGLGERILPISVLMVLVLGLWVYRHRHIDLWLLLGITGYVSRFWTYHRWYDDLLILLPMIALFRIAKDGSGSHWIGVVAGTLLSITMVLMLAPGGLFVFPRPWDTWYVSVQTLVWLMGLAFLLIHARNEKTGAA